MLAQSLAPTTRSGYQSAVSHLAKFMEKHNTPLTFPVPPDTICLWMADSVKTLRFSSIRNYLHGIATTQKELGFTEPLLSAPLIWRMFKGIKRIQGQQVVRKRLPITVKILSQINHLFDTSKEEHLCMRATMWLGTCGLLRSGEFTRKPSSYNSLKLQQLTFHDHNDTVLDPHRLNGVVPHYMTLRLEQSKTDVFRKGANVVIGNDRAIRYMLEYLQHRKPTLAKVPLLAGLDGQPLSTAALVSFTQDFIKRAHIPNSHLFLGHSFRKGGATSLHEAGHPDSLIKMMGRWASFAFATYIDPPLTVLVSAGRSLQRVDNPTTATLSSASHSSFWDVNDLH